MLGYGGIHKPRSRFGHWLDQQGILQSEIVEKTGLSRGTISRICNDDEYIPKKTTVVKIQRALKDFDCDALPSDIFH